MFCTHGAMSQGPRTTENVQEDHQSQDNTRRVGHANWQIACRRRPIWGHAEQRVAGEAIQKKKWRNRTPATRRGHKDT